MQSQVSHINEQWVINAWLDSENSNVDEVTAHYNHRLRESLRQPCRSKSDEIYIDFLPMSPIEIDTTGRDEADGKRTRQ